MIWNKYTCTETLLTNARPLIHLFIQTWRWDCPCTTWKIRQNLHQIQQTRYSSRRNFC